MDKKEILSKKVKNISNDWEQLERELIILKPRVKCLLEQIESIQKQLQECNKE